MDPTPAVPGLPQKRTRSTAHLRKHRTRIVSEAQKAINQQFKRISDAYKAANAHCVYGYCHTNAKGALEVYGSAEFVAAVRATRLESEILDHVESRGTRPPERLQRGWRDLPVWRADTGLRSLVYDVLTLVQKNKAPRYCKEKGIHHPDFNQFAPGWWPAHLPYVSPTHSAALGISADTYRGALISIVESIYAYFQSSDLLDSQQVGGERERETRPAEEGTLAEERRSPVAELEPDVEESQPLLVQTGSHASSHSSRTPFASPRSSPADSHSPNPQHPSLVPLVSYQSSSASLVPSCEDAASSSRGVPAPPLQRLVPLLASSPSFNPAQWECTNDAGNSVTVRYGSQSPEFQVPIGSVMQPDQSLSLGDAGYHLEDQDINQFQALLRQNFPFVGGLRDIGALEVSMYPGADGLSGERDAESVVQISHSLRSGHWSVTVTTPKVPHAVIVLDSIPDLKDNYSGSFLKSTALLHVSREIGDGCVRTLILSPVEQEDAWSCGFLACAFAWDAARGLLPQDRDYHIPTVCRRVTSALQENALPEDAVSKAKRKQNAWGGDELLITSHCCGRLYGPPEAADPAGEMVQCDLCQRWFHTIPACCARSPAQIRFLHDSPYICAFCGQDY